MYYELSKSEKKIARQLIDKGLDAAYTEALKAAQIVVSKWSAGETPNKEAYMDIYREIAKHDGHIAQRYNNLGGSKYLSCVAELFAEDVITEKDIALFNEETQKVIYVFSGKARLA